MTDGTSSIRRTPENAEALPHLEAHVVAAYLDRRLPGAETATVEAHLANCAACRSEVVALGELVRPRQLHRRLQYTGLAIAAAAALLLFVSPERLGVPGEPEGSPRSKAALLRLQALGAVEQPPVYLGVSVRAPLEREAELFAAGMRAYTDAQYAEAVRSLKGAQAAGNNGATIPFFLGASLLMLGDAIGAAEQFALVIGMGDTPYRAEAHYYRAKALLRLDQPNDAAAELDLSIKSGVDDVQRMAQSLRDSLRVLQVR